MWGSGIWSFETILQDIKVLSTDMDDDILFHLFAKKYKKELKMMLSEPCLKSVK